MDPVQEQLDAYNARDLERFLACYADDVVVTSADGTAMMSGIDAMRTVYSALFANSPNLRAELGVRFKAGRYVVDEERVTGLNLPGLPESMHAAVAYRVEVGRIVHVVVLA